MAASTRSGRSSWIEWPLPSAIVTRVAPGESARHHARHASMTASSVLRRQARIVVPEVLVDREDLRRDPLER